MLSTVLFVSTALAQVAAGPDPVACIKTTIGATGQTSKSEIVTTSGNKAQDRGALRFLKALDFSRLPTGVELDQTGYIIVRATGPDTYTIDATDGRLLDACPTPTPYADDV